VKYSNVQLCCLPGTPKTKSGMMPARQPAHTISAAGFLKLLTREMPVTTAADEGAITVWYDPTRKTWRGERHRYHQCVDSIEFPSRVRGLRMWVRKTLAANRGL
jgi:hypothetical protein